MRRFEWRFANWMMPVWIWTSTIRQITRKPLNCTPNSLVEFGTAFSRSRVPSLAFQVQDSRRETRESPASKRQLKQTGGNRGGESLARSTSCVAHTFEAFVGHSILI